jgi:ribosomal protein S16
VAKWIGNGAQPTERVARLLSQPNTVEETVAEPTLS